MSFRLVYIQDISKKGIQSQYIYTALKIIFSLSKCSEKMVFSKKSCWNMIFLILSHWMKKIIFVSRKFVKRIEKFIFSLVFVCFRFTEISYVLNFPSNENVRKQHLSANAYSCVNMKFSYTIAGLKFSMKFFMSYCNENKRFFASV